MLQGSAGLCGAVIGIDVISEACTVAFLPQVTMMASMEFQVTTAYLASP